MKNKILPYTLVLFVLAVSASASAISIDIDINHFTTASENSSSIGTLTGGMNNAMSETSIQTYTLTDLDFTSIGGTATETITFSVVFTGTENGETANVRYTTWGDVFIGAISFLGVNDVFTANLGTITSSFSGGGNSVSFVGFTNAYTKAYVISNESVDVVHNGGTIVGAAQNQTFAPSSFFSVIPTVGDMRVGGFDLRITAVPELSMSSLLLGITGLTSVLVCRRR